MSRIDFVRPTGELRFLGDILPKGPYKASAEKIAAEISETVTRFEEADFAAAGLSVALRARYADPESVQARVEAFRKSIDSRRPTAAYVVGQYVERPSTCSRPGYDIRRIGMLSFMRTDDKPRFMESYRRAMSGWYDRSRLRDDRRTVPEEDDMKFDYTQWLFNQGIDVARASGLRELDVEVVEEKAGKNPDLVVVEHTVVLPSFGFEQVKTGPVEIEGETFESTTWRREL